MRNSDIEKELKLLNDICQGIEDIYDETGCYPMDIYRALGVMSIDMHIASLQELYDLDQHEATQRSRETVKKAMDVIPDVLEVIYRDFEPETVGDIMVFLSTMISTIMDQETSESVNEASSNLN